MEVSTYYPCELSNILTSKYNIDRFGQIMEEGSSLGEGGSQTISVASSSSICFDDRDQEMIYQNIIEAENENTLERQIQPQEVTFIQTEESLSDCPTYFVNQRRKKYSSHSTNTEIFDQRGELFGNQCRSLKRKLSCENYFHPPIEDLSMTLTTTISKFDLPLKKIVSQPELNSDDEIKAIEENVRANNQLAQRHFFNSYSSCSYSDDDDDDDDDKICASFCEFDGSEDCFYTKITSQYPLMSCPFKRSTESLVAVLDFDINDDLGSPSGIQHVFQ